MKTERKGWLHAPGPYGLIYVPPTLPCDRCLPHVRRDHGARDDGLNCSRKGCLCDGYVPEQDFVFARETP